MGKRSTRENKNIYQLSREHAGLTREKAAEKLIYISDDRIEKLENEKLFPHPEEVMTMAEAYRDARLPNYYCTHECPIGKKYIPELELRDLSGITIEVVDAINQLNKEKDRLIEIAVDGRISDDEQADFSVIKEELERIARAVQTLRLYIEQTALEKEAP